MSNASTTPYTKCLLPIHENDELCVYRVFQKKPQNFMNFATVIHHGQCPSSGYWRAPQTEKFTVWKCCLTAEKSPDIRYLSTSQYGNTWWRACFYGSDTPAYQKFIGTLYMSAHGIRNSNQAILQETATGSTIPPALTKNFDTNMLTRDLFAVANFLVINSNNTCNSGITPIKRDELSKCKSGWTVC